MLARCILGLVTVTVSWYDPAIRCFTGDLGFGFVEDSRQSPTTDVASGGWWSAGAPMLSVLPGWIPFRAGPPGVSAVKAGRIIVPYPVVMPGCDQRLLRTGLLCGPGMAASWVDTREMRSWP
jgi:hypothetical protein